ncbi:aldehyde dehydrogenase family protein [Pseudomaricurvus alkylphenolicus]|uniref:aldehyde dehydrogenase family protein n=1 Tax=Pseudomaricurvus alkylphenolicus TaxID=1306991 RepID=UPI001422F00E|nr:aldehyde dehydrogenase family protein [Pseudomaricurvus alkylphenolicus]NIB38505.1 aldehyde dehydrogenase family protein [Pseudomaricurvus alkylphenolicus]
MSEYQLHIGGRYQAAESGLRAPSLNPANGEVLATVQQAGESDVLRALEAAQCAFNGWKQVLPSQREAVFLKAADVVDERAQELRDLLIDESGSTLIKAGYEVHHAAAFLRGMAGECRRVTGETYSSDYAGVKSYSIRRPLGVVVAISPFNFPLLLGLRKIGWAMAAGNSVVLKPSEETPVVGLKIAEIFQQAGLPDGVLNVIPGRASDMGDALLADPRVKKITFTGSSEVGKMIAAKAAANLKKFTLELGGKNPLVILEDADLDYAVNTATFSNFMHQGQICMTGSRVIVEAGLYDEFCRRVAAKVAALKTGSPREPGVVIGPLIRPTQPAFIQEQVESAVDDGARLLTGGKYEGSYYLPTVLADVTENMSIFRTECFGPVMSIIKADDYLHALTLANDSDYGLSSAVLTNDLQKALHCSESLETGMVHINGPTVRDEAVVPFGGVKDSGFGREGGRFAMEEFTELKWVTIQTGQQQYPF